MKNFSLTLALILSGLTPAHAGPVIYYPIQSITLSYDLTRNLLHVDAVHHADNWENDYVRLMTVAVNGQILASYDYYHQTSAAGFSDSVEVKAVPGDVITVVLYLTGGMSKSQDLTVPSPDAQAGDQGADAASTNSTADNAAH